MSSPGRGLHFVSSGAGLAETAVPGLVEPPLVVPAKAGRVSAGENTTASADTKAARLARRPSRLQICRKTIAAVRPP